MEPWNENGDLIAKDGMTFRQVGWLVNGGPKDKLFIPVGLPEKDLEISMSFPHGGLSPVYVEVGD